VPSEALHKVGVAVRAVVLAAHIRVNHIRVYLGRRQDGLGLDLFNDHQGIITGADFLSPNGRDASRGRLIFNSFGCAAIN
jgi:hypothetical protein